MRRLGKAGRAGAGAPAGPFGGAVPGGHRAASASLLAAGRSRCPPVAHAGSIHGSCRPGATVRLGCGALSDSRIGPLVVFFIFLGLKLSGGIAWSLVVGNRPSVDRWRTRHHRPPFRPMVIQ